MTTTFTVLDGTGATTTPAVVEGFASEADSQNVVTNLIGGGIAVTLTGGELQAGSWKLVYLDEPAATAAFALFRRAARFSVTSDRPGLAMTFVRSGRLGRAVSDSTGAAWVLEVGYQEVAP